MAPPTYNDLGKSAKDLFNKVYAHGFIKVDATTKSNGQSAVEFKTAASHNLTSQKLAGNLDIKYKVPQYGLTLTEKWNTENVLGTVVEVKDQFAKGVKVTLDTSYNPNSAKRSGVLKTEWASDRAKVNADVTLVAGPVLNLAAVFAQNNWLIGGQGKFDLSTNELKSTSFAAGYDHPEYTLHTFANDANEFGASWYHKVDKNVELGAQLGWTVGDHATRFGLATKYRLSDDISLRGKVDNKSTVALSSTHNLSDALKLTFSTQFNLVNTPDTTNKFGVGLEYTP
ncbi:eukaryotic porin domain-containing protein [Ditylenchus destructor]|uniref:Eukaryotic porin domain-containing protein n=1 Tax=Ditylenchus destructor TaxID=166010 RepID=A0AAD4N8W9_9BILA|nr:eukaryotic porin domain-containing protein [Ditylenchus destructor]